MSDPFILEGEEVLREGDTRQWSVIWEDFDSVSTGSLVTTGASLSSKGTRAFINGSDKTSDLLSGTTSASGNALTLPLLTVPVGQGGNTIVIEPVMNDTVQTYKTGITIRVLKPGAER